MPRSVSDASPDRICFLADGCTVDVNVFFSSLAFLLVRDEGTSTLLLGYTVIALHKLKQVPLRSSSISEYMFNPSKSS